MSLMASPTYGTAAVGLTLVCSVVYGLDTLIGPETFLSAEFHNQANKWCAKGYGVLTATAVLPKDTINIAIKLLESLKTLN